MKKIKILSTFTGIGSPEMALRNIGVPFEMIGISEVDRYALLAYEAIHEGEDDGSFVYPSKEEMLKEFEERNIAYNFSSGKSEVPKNIKDIQKLYRAHKRNKNFGDIRQIDEQKLPDFDLFTYSFPCKNISVAGKQASLEEGSGTQSSLLWECRRIIKHKKPKYLLMENVANLMYDPGHREYLEMWIDEVRKFGYRSYTAVLNGTDFGVTQNRRRVMMVSILDGKKKDFQMPTGEPTTRVVEDDFEDVVQENMFFEDDYCPHIDKHIKKRSKKYQRPIRVGHVSESVRQWSHVYSSKGTVPTMCTDGRINIQVDDDTNPRGYHIRRLTPLETWRLMGYTDDDFKKAKEIAGLADTKLYERAGRGIVIPMLEAILSNLFLNTKKRSLRQKVKDRKKKND